MLLTIKTLYRTTKHKHSGCLLAALLLNMLVIMSLASNKAYSEALGACMTEYSAEYCEYRLNRESM